MAVIHHALRWEMSDAGCAAAAAIARLARAGDADGLSALGELLYRQASAFAPALAAFELADRDYVTSWLALAAVHPALVTLLAWAPELVVLEEGEAAALAALHRRGGSPVAPLALMGSSFLPLARALRGVFGPSPFCARPAAGQLGMWVRPTRLVRRLSEAGDHNGANGIAAMAGGDPERSWLVTTTVW